MKWLIRWSHEAARNLDRLDPDVAERILGALDRFVLEGAGDVRRLVGIEPPGERFNPPSSSR